MKVYRRGGNLLMHDGCMGVVYSSIVYIHKYVYYINISTVPRTLVVVPEFTGKEVNIDIGTAFS